MSRKDTTQTPWPPWCPSGSSPTRSVGSSCLSRVKLFYLPTQTPYLFHHPSLLQGLSSSSRLFRTSLLCWIRVPPGVWTYIELHPNPSYLLSGHSHRRSYYDKYLRQHIINIYLCIIKSFNFLYFITFKGGLDRVCQMTSRSHSFSSLSIVTQKVEEGVRVFIFVFFIHVSLNIWPSLLQDLQVPGPRSLKIILNLWSIDGFVR